MKLTGFWRRDGGRQRRRARRASTVRRSPRRRRRRGRNSRYAGEAWGRDSGGGIDFGSLFQRRRVPRCQLLSRFSDDRRANGERSERSSCSGNTVRTSSSTAPPCTRPSTGGVAGPQPTGQFRRRRPRRPSPRRRPSAVLGPAIEPPPTKASSSRASAVRRGKFAVVQRASRLAAVTRPSGCPSSRRTGTPANAFASSRYSRSVASRAASVILSSRKARISGSFSIRLDRTPCGRR